VLLFSFGAAEDDLARKVVTQIFSEHLNLAVVSLFSDLVFAAPYAC
jgi:hypothetical protein